MKAYFQEKQILAKINQGDEDTFLKMYNYYAPRLFKHACFRLGSREQAEDMAQQVFYKTWQYIINSEHKIDNLNAFLYKTLNNLIADYYRRPGNENISLDNPSNGLEEKLSVEPLYEEAIDQDLEKNKVRESLKQLTVDQQKLIIWRYFDDLSVSEIAKVSGKSFNAVYVGIHRSLKELKKVTNEVYEKI
ncbi:MAG: RNA polymerase sigma factor [Patescibacteria group bacterium]|jgi:RNA polymerase sigma-70 factor (ECF subfamily)